MLQNSRVTVFTVSELLGESQQGGGVKMTRSPPKFGLNSASFTLFVIVYVFTFNFMNSFRKIINTINLALLINWTI